jgi:2-polyprenyl-6-methoxyphenol hydroxylase-like FAD-dependent oxidoreductase
MRKTQHTQRTHAVVIGGSIAGLLATRVLLNHFEKVTLIERDHYPKVPTFRPGIPQARQLHTMLLRGQHILEELFPNFTRKLLAQGAFERDYGNDCLYYYELQCPTVPPVLRGWNCTRYLVEWQIRQELMNSPHLSVIEGHEVTDFLFDPSTHTITGVQFRERNHCPNNPIQERKADLVIDASGASSHVLQWLEPLGYKIPETVIPTHLGYATQHYEAPEHYPLKGIVIQTTQPPFPRGGTLMTVEKGRWIIGLGGIEDYPPTKQAGFLAFAKTLPDQTLYEATQTGKPCSPIYGYRRTENRRRHFENIRNLEGLVVVGDALCTFNPTYGQGMTVCAMEAQALDACLTRSKGLRGLAHAFQQHAARILRAPWASAIAIDGQKQGFATWYRKHLISLASDDPKTFLRVLEVAHMLRHPMALIHPTLVLRVITHWLHFKEGK